MYRIYVVFLIFSVFMTGGNVYGQEPLTATEAQITAWIDAHNDESINLLEASVNINSGSLNISGVKAVADQLEKELSAIGLDTEWIQLPADMKRAGHLFARTNGTRGKKIVLIGHLDTVFEPDDAFQHFERNGNWATGPGITDMKSGNIIILQALKALHAVGALKDTRIVVAFSGDEESPGTPVSVTRKALIDAGKWADVALGFEHAMRDEKGEWATVSRRGYTGWCLEVDGKQGHSSQIFTEEAGAGAIFETARILNDFYETVRGDAYLTFNAGTIAGGTEVTAGCDVAAGNFYGKPNVIPGRAVVRGEMRTVSEEQTIRTKAAMQAIVQQHLPVTNATITFDDGYPAMAPTERNLHLYERLSEINQSLGRGPMHILDPLRRGAADISFVAPYADSLAGMGGYGEGAHSPKESFDLSSLPVATKRAALMIYQLSRAN
ncbi:M20/M25/M40 family metallo-hydrolase [Kordiimonas pumila]|uniref:M20/M25/M40 family metallo-hydrolase n=1 Tax=Kordiimonas pumila TaxID=2161677 RepID=A0ABV7D4G4_9PROT|nr:M20/M25/M40 family metallo-hydrolase [Kordiimonas pumila]